MGTAAWLLAARRREEGRHRPRGTPSTPLPPTPAACSPPSPILVTNPPRGSAHPGEELREALPTDTPHRLTLRSSHGVTSKPQHSPLMRDLGHQGAPSPGPRGVRSCSCPVPALKGRPPSWSQAEGAWVLPRAWEGPGDSGLSGPSEGALHIHIQLATPSKELIRN